MKSEIEKVIASVCRDLYGTNIDVELTRPDEQFGDYSTNAALQLSQQTGTNPRLVAESIVDKLKIKLKSRIVEVTVAGPGFINLKLNDKSLIDLVVPDFSKSLKNKSIVAEYSDPNPFKVLHAGHLYTSIVGDSISKLLEVAGAKVHRVNFGGDVGLHVGKTMYVILKRLGGENPIKLDKIVESDRSKWLAECYIEGSKLYDTNQKAKTGIVALNKRVYNLHETKDKSSAFAQIYWTTRQWSYDYFDSFYDQIGSHFDKYYPESETAGLGLKTVNKYIGKVFAKSDGAVVFRGEEFGLHTRVFITSEGLPTYETKDVGLIMAKNQDYKFDKSIVITGNEQAQYMAVVLKAIEQFEPKLASATTHLTHGMVKLAGGAKMSSRKGNILGAEDVIQFAEDANKKLTGKNNPETALSAVKYAFLKSRMGGDIIYDPNESVAIEGNSGPYIQYAHARARSILSKTQANSIGSIGDSLELDERSLARKIGEFSEVVDKSVDELMPHLICTYLYELAQVFNRFYENNRVLDDPRQDQRLFLVRSYADVLRDGLAILNIPAPDKM